MTFKRVILTVPEGLSFDNLTTEQQEAIRSVFGQYVLPMPNTIPNAGKVLCDAVTTDQFNPSRISELGLPFVLIGMFDGDGLEVIPLNTDAFLSYIPNPPSGPKVLYETHRWAGWPKCFGV